MFWEKRVHMSDLGTHGWGRAAYSKSGGSILLSHQVPHRCGCSVLGLQVSWGAFPGPASLAPQLGQDFWTLNPRLDSRDCPSQWTCIFPLALYLNPVVLPAGYQPHPYPHPPLCGLLIGAQTLRLPSFYCLQPDPPPYCSMSLAPLPNLEQPERSVLPPSPLAIKPPTLLQECTLLPG